MFAWKRWLSTLHKLFRTDAPRRNRPRGTVRLQLETLEGRDLPSVLLHIEGGG